MAITPTFPGVYIQEIPSGVRTITGVATSITAFLGLAKRGPVKKAVQIFNIKDYENTFGGLSEDSAMSFAVNQFFLNGGSEAWVVRLALNPALASLVLQNSNPNGVVTITAIDEGEEGNNIQVEVDASTSPGRFNLLLSYIPKDNPADSRIETFKGLSMDPRDSRYIADAINNVSRLVTVKVGVSSTSASGSSTALVPASPTTVTASFEPGKLISGPFGATDLDHLPDDKHTSFKIGLDGNLAKTVVTLDKAPAVGSNLAEKLGDIASRIQAAVRALKPGLPSWRGFTCTVSQDKTALVLASGTIGAGSVVEVADLAAGDSTQNSIFTQLHLDKATPVPGSIADPPAPLGPQPGKLASGAFGATDLDALPDEHHTSFRIGFDGNPAKTVVTLDKAPAVGSNLAEKLGDIASRIQKAVRALKPGLPAWNGFTCTVSNDKTALVLASGTLDVDSAVEVDDLDPADPTQTNSIFTQLHLDNATPTVPGNPVLAGGVAEPFDINNDGSEVLFPTDGSRTGIFALDEVDLFNLLCIPGVTDAGIINQAIAYCKGRRAFMIVDPDPSLDRTGMIKFITGPNLTKADLGTYAAIYFPQIKAPDPLNNGKLRSFPPSGMIAGLYARTDSTRGVWKAPAGTEATIVNVRGMDFLLTDAENGSLNPLGVNCLRIFPVYGAVCWGTRTVSGADELASEYKYVPVRRLALYIEESLYRGTKWVVFEPNDEPLWAQIRLNVGAFMHNLFVKGAFQGATPKEAYFVKCDKETTTQNDIDLGIVNILVGFAPLKPAEFVVISLQQIAGQLLV